MQNNNLLNFKDKTHNEQLAKIPHNFAVEHDEDKGVTEMTIYGIIGDSWFRESTSATQIDEALKDASGNDLVIRINSPGGDAFEGVAIYNRLMHYKKEHDAKISSYVDGYACSAASLLPLAADESIMGLGAMMMIHEASTIEWGSKKEFRKTLELLEKLETGIIDIYATKGKKTREELQAMVDDETWFTAQEAVDIGFATEVAQPEPEPDEDLDDDSEGAENKSAEMNDFEKRLKSMQKEIDSLKRKKEPEPKEPAKNSRAFLF